MSSDDAANPTQQQQRNSAEEGAEEEGNSTISSESESGDKTTTTEEERCSNNSSTTSNNNDAQATNATQSSAIRKKRVDDFEFTKVLGKGSYGVVKLATEKETLKQYAIKILNKQHIIKEKKAKYVQTEKLILDQLKHPNIITLFYTFQDPTKLYFVFEYCLNKDVRSKLNEVMVGFDDESAKFYAAELLLGIEYLHSKRIIHRDLKPENILFDSCWHSKIIDFGTAKQLQGEDTTIESAVNQQDGATQRERSDSFVGTAEYVSPELLLEQPASFAVDLWAYGVILYQLICGRTPFRGPTDYHTFQNIMNVSLTYPSGFPEDAADLLNQLLVKDPKKRAGDFEIIKGHPFYSGVQWQDLFKMSPPTIRARSTPFTFPVVEEPETEEDCISNGVHQTSSEASLPHTNIDRAERSLGSSKSSPSIISSELSKKDDLKWTTKYLKEGEEIEKFGVVSKKGVFMKKKYYVLLTNRARILLVEYPSKTIVKHTITLNSKHSVQQKRGSHTQFTLNLEGKILALEDSEGAASWISSITNQISKSV